MARGKLDDEVKAFIVMALACWDTPSEVAAAVKEEFELELTRQQVQSYDPTKTAGRTLGKKWVAMFSAARKAFVDETVMIPIAQRAYRLRQLDKMAREMGKRKNIMASAQLLEQAAKEVGDAYTNRRQISGPGGGAIPLAAITVPEDQVKAASEKLLEFLKGGKVKA